MSKDSSRDLVRLKNYPGWYIVPATGQLVLRTTINGRRHKIRTGVTGRLNKKTGICEGIAAARKAADDFVESVKTGKTGVELELHTSGVTNPSVDSIWKILFSERTIGKSDGTRKNYAKAYKHGLRGFWGEPPTDPDELAEDTRLYPYTIPAPPYFTADRVDDISIVQYKAWYLQHRGDKLFDKTFDFLKMLLSFGVKRGFFKKLPDVTPLTDIDEIIKQRTKYEKAGRVYTTAEQRRLLDAWRIRLGGDENPSRHEIMLAARMRAFAALGLRAGMRFSEIARRKREDVDLRAGVINVWSDKNTGWRQIPLVEETRSALVYQLEATAHLDSEFLFPSPSDPSRYISHQVFEKTWYRTREIAAIKDVGAYGARFHDCRKTFATMTAEQGWPVKVACEILDMSLLIYERVYVSQISLEVKQAMMARSFGEDE